MFGSFFCFVPSVFLFASLQSLRDLSFPSGIESRPQQQVHRILTTKPSANSLFTSFSWFVSLLKKSEFILWSNSLAQQLLSPHSKITELELWDSQITNRRQCCNPWSLDAQNLFTITEALTQRNLLAAFRESPCAATKTQCNQKLKTIIMMMIIFSSCFLHIVSSWI